MITMIIDDDDNDDDDDDDDDDVIDYVLTNYDDDDVSFLAQDIRRRLCNPSLRVVAEDSVIRHRSLGNQVKRFHTEVAVAINYWIRCLNHRPPRSRRSPTKS